jgi:hypothetical protein
MKNDYAPLIKKLQTLSNNLEEIAEKEIAEIKQKIKEIEFSFDLDAEIRAASILYPHLYPHLNKTVDEQA